MTEHIGIIRVDGKLLLDLLDFKDGEIIDIRMEKSGERYSAQGIEIVLKHQDMPEIDEGYAIPRCVPEYTKNRYGRIKRR